MLTNTCETGTRFVEVNSENDAVAAGRAIKTDSDIGEVGRIDPRTLDRHHTSYPRNTASGIRGFMADYLLHHHHHHHHHHQQQQHPQMPAGHVIQGGFHTGDYQQRVSQMKTLDYFRNWSNFNQIKAESHQEKDGKKAVASDSGFSGLSAFLGPNLWEKTVPYDGLNDMKLEYMDLDEFLIENTLETDTNLNDLRTPVSPTHSLGSGGLSPLRVNMPSTSVADQSMGLRHDSIEQQLSPTIPTECPSASSSPQQVRSPQQVQSPQQVNSPPSAGGPHSPVSGDVKVDYPLSHADVVLSTIPGTETFDPRKRAFSDEELRPQPMIKKSKKIFVPDELKDGKYWSRRQKNNIAAKRSRDARRIKENQIALRAGYLEKENNQLKLELEKVRMENKELKNRITKLEKGACD